MCCQGGGKRKPEAHDGDYASINNGLKPANTGRNRARVGAQVRKRYDIAKTPYQRVLESETVSTRAKRRLRDQYLQLNPAALLRQIETLQEELWRYRELSSRAARPQS